MQLSSCSIDLTPAERAAFEARERKAQALLLRMADSTPEESERLAGGFFHELRAARRIEAARRPRVVEVVSPIRDTACVAAPRERRVSSSSRTSGQDPGDDDPEPSPSRRLDSHADLEAVAWALSLASRKMPR